MVDCGELKGEDKLTAEQCDFLHTYDEAPIVPQSSKDAIEERRLAK